MYVSRYIYAPLQNYMEGKLHLWDSISFKKIAICVYIPIHTEYTVVILA